MQPQMRQSSYFYDWLNYRLNWGWNLVTGGGEDGFNEENDESIHNFKSDTHDAIVLKQLLKEMANSLLLAHEQGRKGQHFSALGRQILKKWFKNVERI